MNDDLNSIGMSIAGAEGGHLVVYAVGLALKGRLEDGEGVELYRRSLAYVRACEAAMPHLKEKNR